MTKKLARKKKHHNLQPINSVSPKPLDGAEANLNHSALNHSVYVNSAYEHDESDKAKLNNSSAMEKRKMFGASHQQNISIETDDSGEM